ncbi:MAG: hypothetical protein U0529_14170 [Thermoanaerobaculia bacterium]
MTPVAVARLVRWSALAVISGGLLAVGSLFLASALLRRRTRPPAEAPR